MADIAHSTPASFAPSEENEDGRPDRQPRRRGFLKTLITAPLAAIATHELVMPGGWPLIGNPSAAAEPMSEALLHSYDAWLFYERRYLRHEVMGERALGSTRFNVEFDPNGIRLDNAGGEYHWSSDPQSAPQPSTRAAIVLSAVGCDWRRA